MKITIDIDDHIDLNDEEIQKAIINYLTLIVQNAEDYAKQEAEKGTAISGLRFYVEESR